MIAYQIGVRRAKITDVSEADVTACQLRCLVRASSSHEQSFTAAVATLRVTERAHWAAAETSSYRLQFTIAARELAGINGSNR